MSEPRQRGLTDSGVQDDPAGQDGSAPPARPAGSSAPVQGRSGNWWDRRRPADQPGAPVPAPTGRGPAGSVTGGRHGVAGSPVTAEQSRTVDVTPARRNERRAPARGPRRARLQLRNVDPWSMLKFSLVLAIALFVVWMVAVGVLYGVLDGMGVFGKLNRTVDEINGSTQRIITPQIVFGAAAVVGVVNIVLFTAFATLGSFIYNICADMVGGLEVTLAEHE